MRIIIVGGARRGKSTLAAQLAEEYKLTHLCTDPQRMLPASMKGTPDELDYSGELGVGVWVARNWLGKDRTVIEGVKAIDAVKRALADGAKSSSICDRLIVLTERVGDDEGLPGQERQAAHTMAVLEELEDQLDNLELYYPVDGGFKRADY